jgi:hypothetical protein
MGWIKTKTARFIEEEIVAVQYLPSNYSRSTDELILSLRGGAQLKFAGEEANALWQRFEDEAAADQPGD